jgi:hypothetical protein
MRLIPDPHVWRVMVPRMRKFCEARGGSTELGEPKGRGKAKAFDDDGSSTRAPLLDAEKSPVRQAEDAGSDKQISESVKREAIDWMRRRKAWENAKKVC